jgi:hypothetical protein
MLCVTRNSTKRSSTIRYLRTIWHYLTSPHQYAIPLNLTQQYLHRTIHVWTTPVQICTAPNFAGPIRPSTLPNQTLHRLTYTRQYSAILYQYTNELDWSVHCSTNTPPHLYVAQPYSTFTLYFVFYHNDRPRVDWVWSPRLNTVALDCTVTMLCHAEPCCTFALRRFARPLLNSQPIHQVLY